MQKKKIATTTDIFLLDIIETGTEWWQNNTLLYNLCRDEETLWDFFKTFNRRKNFLSSWISLFNGDI